LAPLPESETWLENLNDELPSVRIEKNNHKIVKMCERARILCQKIDEDNLPIQETIEMMQEMHELDQASLQWRDGPGWAYKTIHRSQISLDEAKTANFPELVQLHQDVWIAYEWNYHRIGRVIMHEHLLECLDRLHSVCSGDQASLRPALCSLEENSIATIKSLIDDVLATVPQSLGDIDHEGKLSHNATGAKTVRGIGSYFLLWPIKVSKSTRSASSEQKDFARGVFERIREYTGMKTALGDLSKI
jgi:hypothetical protein